MKICSRCRQEKPLSEFTKDKSRKDGLYLNCRECERERYRNRYKPSTIKKDTLQNRLDSPLKKCGVCKSIKDKTEFSPSKNRFDGYSNNCKECQRNLSRDNQRHRRESLDVRRAEAVRSREYNKTEKRRKSKHNDPSKVRERINKFARSHPEVIKSHRAVHAAINNGIIPHPSTLLCSHPDCNETATEYHHYLGYSPEHWLDVQALCRFHHGVTRRKY